MKKMICLLLSSIVILGMPINVSAKEEVKDGTVCSESLTITQEQMTDEQIEQFYGLFGIGDDSAENEMQIGESRTIYQDGKGNKLVVRLTAAENSSMARSTSQTASRTFYFYDENWLGQLVTVFKVDAVCEWVSDGENSRITKLTTTYTNYKSSKYSLAWDDSSISNYVATLWLRVRIYGTETYYIAFSAFCHCIGDNALAPYVVISNY